MSPVGSKVPKNRYLFKRNFCLWAVFSKTGAGYVKQCGSISCLVSAVCKSVLSGSNHLALKIEQNDKVGDIKAAGPVNNAFNRKPEILKKNFDVSSSVSSYFTHFVYLVHKDALKQ